MESENFTMDIDAGALASIKPNTGVGFKRVPFGHYRFRITAVERKAKEGDRPHVMLKPTFVILHAYDERNKAAVGMSTDGLYAGSKQSPKFMQERLANLIGACGIQLQAGQALSSAMFVGCEFDGSVTWEKGKASFNEETGQMDKVYVNSRIIGERPVGGAAPAGLDPARESAEAVRYLEERYGDAGIADDAPAANGGAAAPPWAAPQAPSLAEAPAPSGFKPEAEAPDQVHQYRAYIKLSPEHGPAAREQLIGAGFDPDGPIDASKLPEPLKGQYVAKFGGAPLTGLPPLNGGSSTRWAAGPTPARKGTRSKSV